MSTPLPPWSPPFPPAPSRMGPGNPHTVGWGWRAHTPARPSPVLPPQCPPTVCCGPCVPPGCEGCLLRAAGLQPVLDGPPHRKPAAVAAGGTVLPAEGIHGPARPIGGLT